MWDELGIPPTDDPKVIRRAYAARLKRIDPDRDREAFARLRQALEAALARAGATSWPECPRPAVDSAWETPTRNGPSATLDVLRADPARSGAGIVPAGHFSTPDEPPAAPCRSADSVRDRAVLSELDSALQRQDARGATELYFRAAASGALPLDAAERMLARLFEVALADPTLDPPAFRALAKSVGWDRPELDSGAVSAVRQRVSARLAAEDWYDEVVAIAERRKQGVSRRGARTGRVVLGRIRGWGLFRINREALVTTLDRLEPHAAWLAGRIHPAWVATLRRRLRRRELLSNAGAILILTFLLLDAVVVFIGSVAGIIEDSSAVAAVALVPLAAVLGWLLKLLVQHFRALWRSRP